MTTKTTTSYPSEVLASVTTGVLWCNFSAMHEAIEFLMGHPVWTHEMGSEERCETFREQALAQHPQLAALDSTLKPFTGRPEKVADAVKTIHRAVGPSLTITKGALERDKSPIETLGEVLDR